MFNLSDKDLDRLSQEAAQQHEPGDIIGPRLWEKLEARLDRDLGKVNPNPARGIRRLPYYYAPAFLLILGVSYYLVRLNSKSHKVMSSGSPPLSVTQPASADPLKPVRSSSNPVQSDKSNSTPTAPSNTIQYPGTANTSADASPSAPAAPARSDASRLSAAQPDATNANTSPTSTDLTNSSTSFGQRLSRSHNKPTNSKPHKSTDLSYTAGTAGEPGSSASDDRAANTTASTTAAPAPRDLTYSAVRGPGRLAHAGRISDSALRAIN